MQNRIESFAVTGGFGSYRERPVLVDWFDGVWKSEGVVAETGGGTSSRSRPGVAAVRTAENIFRWYRLVDGERALGFKLIAYLSRQFDSAVDEEVRRRSSEVSVTWSGTLRELLQMAWAEECEKMTGAFEVASASSIVGTDTCERSTIMPSRFISETTSVPKWERPPMCGTRPGSSTLQQSAHGVLQVCVSVR
uniref:Uncharacterized protein n=1 Tax=Anopheles farauti TaxID=69004 RepID=A0A182Q4M9_9DIPT